MNSIFDYTLKSLGRFGWKNFSIAFIFMLLVWLLSSVILITDSIKQELQSTAKDMPSLLITKQVGTRTLYMNENDIEPLWEIPGVSFVKGRVWGQYYLEFKKTYLSLVGIDAYEDGFNDEITKIAETYGNDGDEGNYAYLSHSVYELLKEYRLADNSVKLERYDESYENLMIKGEFKAQTELLSNDTILMPSASVRRILGIPEGEFSDAVVKVANPNEVSFIAAKIMYLYPKLKVTTKDEILKDYELLYQFKSGWFLLVFIVSFFTFAIILYDKASGLRSEEKREIGILKALGWEINHIIYAKILENIILSCGAFLVGLGLALFYVYFLDAVGLKYVFSGYSNLKQPFDLAFVFNFRVFALLFFSTVPLFIATSIIPSWKASTSDAGEIMR